MNEAKHTKNNFTIEFILEKIKDWNVGDRLIVLGEPEMLTIYKGYEIHNNIIYINHKKRGRGHAIQMSQQYFHYLENIDYFKRLAIQNIEVR